MLDLIKKVLGIEIDPHTIKVREAIELVVEESVPKIRDLSGYRKKLQKPVETALAYCAELTGQIPGVVDLSSRDRTEMALVKGFFKNEEQARALVSESLALQEFLKKEQAKDFYVLLIMHRFEKTAFGSKLQGNMIVRDVASRAILFENHELLFPSPTIEDILSATQLGLLKALAHYALEVILSEQGREVELEKLRDELEVKLKIMRKERQHMVLDWKEEGGYALYTESQSLLDDIEKELRAVKSQTDQREYYLNQLSDILNHPSQYLSVNLIPMEIDRLGIFVKAKSCKAEDSMCIAEFQLSRTDSRSVALIKCHRDLLKSA